MPIQIILRNPLDRDARDYISRAGVTDAAARLQLNEFVRGIKSLGLWESMVCWPLRSSQNAGTGTTVYSLGGYASYSGTLINGPTWGTSGIRFTAANKYINLGTLPITSGAFTSLAALTTVASDSNSNIVGLFQYDPSNPTRGFSSKIYGPTGNAAVSFTGLTGGDRVVGSLYEANVGIGYYWTACGVDALDAPATATGFIQQSTRNATKSGTGNLPYTFASSNYWLFGSQAGTRDETAAFHAWFVGASLTTTQLSQVQSLYKSTMGTGLGLP